MIPTTRYFKKTVIYACLNFLWFSGAVNATGQSLISATQDTYIYSGESSANYGNETNLKIKLSSSGDNDRHAYYHFDLNNFSSSLQSAYFRVAISANYSSNIQVNYSAESWNEDALTWDTRITESDALITIPSVDGNYLKIDIVDVINDYIDAGKDNLTLIISSTDVTSNSLELSSLENSSSYKQPRIYYDSINSRYPFSFGIDYASTERGEFTGHTLKSVSGELQTSQYGGWKNLELGATGYFRTEQINDTWMLVDPDGYAFITMGLNSVVEGGGLELPSAIKSFGINTQGSWSDETIKGITYTPRWNMLTQFKNSDDDIKILYDDYNIVPVFYDEFATFVDKIAQDIAAYADDPYVLGHFSDNELLFHKTQLSSSLALDEDNPQYTAANAWMTDKYNANYSTADITEDDELQYEGYVAATYYKIVSEAIKRYDPNHLYLGSRLHSSAKSNKYIIEAAGTYVDVISINYYGSWEPEDDHLSLWESSGKPFFVTEFYTKAEDSGLDNSDGAGWLVEEQNDRSLFFENFTIGLMRSNAFVGWHWFKYIDDDGSNKGVFDNNYSAYETLQDSMAQIAQQVYPLHSYLLDGTLDFNGAASADSSDNANYVHFTKANSAYAIDGNSGGENGQDAYLWNTNTSNVNQQWLEIDQGDGYYSYQKRNTDFCLDGGNGGENRQNVYLWRCDDNNENQHWLKVEQGVTTFRLEKRGTNYSIDGNNGGQDGQSIYLWRSDDNNANQQWVFSYID